MKKTDSKDGITPSQLIDNQIAELADWRGKILARLRTTDARSRSQHY